MCCEIQWGTERTAQGTQQSGQWDNVLWEKGKLTEESLTVANTSIKNKYVSCVEDASEYVVVFPKFTFLSSLGNRVILKSVLKQKAHLKPCRSKEYLLRQKIGRNAVCLLLVSETNGSATRKMHSFVPYLVQNSFFFFNVQMQTNTLAYKSIRRIHWSVAIAHTVHNLFCIQHQITEKCAIGHLNDIVLSTEQGLGCAALMNSTDRGAACDCSWNVSWWHLCASPCAQQIHGTGHCWEYGSAETATALLGCIRLFLGVLKQNSSLKASGSVHTEAMPKG